MYEISGRSQPGLKKMPAHLSRVPTIRYIRACAIRMSQSAPTRRTVTPSLTGVVEIANLQTTSFASSLLDFTPFAFWTTVADSLLSEKQQKAGLSINVLAWFRLAIRVFYQALLVLDKTSTDFKTCECARLHRKFLQLIGLGLYVPSVNAVSATARYSTVTRLGARAMRNTTWHGTLIRLDVTVDVVGYQRVLPVWVH